MTGQDCFDLINLWKEKSYLSKFELVYDPRIYHSFLLVGAPAKNIKG